MLRKKGFILLLFAFIFDAIVIYAEDEQIILPEVTTVVSGDTLTIGKESIPSYSAVIQSNAQVSEFLPVLPMLEIEESESNEQLSFNILSEKDIFVRGFIRLGYPNTFEGDFNVYKNKKADSFLIDLKHIGHSGYGVSEVRNVTYGYYDSYTLFSGDKHFIYKNLDVSINADYESFNVGLQNKSADFYEIVGQRMEVNNGIEWNLPKNFLIGYKLYSSLSDFYPLGVERATEYGVYIDPRFYVCWNKENISTVFSGEYIFENYAISYINRGFFEASGNIDISSFNIGVKGGVVLSQDLDHTFFALPTFDIAFTSPWFTVNGGIESSLEDFSELLKKYHYSYSDTVCTESSDWIIQGFSSIPLKNIVTINGGLLFKSTAFNKGIWQIDYSNKSENGIYYLSQISRLQFDSSIGVEFSYNFLTLEGIWKSHWVYVPCDDYGHSVSLRCLLSSDEKPWSFDFNVTEPMALNADYVPIIDSSVGYKVNKNIDILLGLEDAVKLLSGKSRSYYGSDYAINSGNAYLKVMFNF